MSLCKVASRMTGYPRVTEGFEPRSTFGTGAIRVLAIISFLFAAIMVQSTAHAQSLPGPAAGLLTELPTDGSAPGPESAQAVAVRTFTLDQAIDHAMTHSGVIAAARADTDIFAAKLAAARWEHWPHLTFSSLLTPMAGQRGDPMVGRTDTSEWGIFTRTEISGYLPLVTFGKIHYLKQARALGVDVGRTQEDIARAEVRFQVHKAFFALSLARELSSVVREGRGYFDKAKRHVSKLEQDDDPSFDPVDKMKIRVYDAQVEQRDLDARRALALALGQTRRMIGEDPQGDVDFATRPPEPLVPRMTVALPVAIDAATDSRPELVALRRGIAARKAEVAARWAAFFPDLVLVGRFTYGYSNVTDAQDSPFANDPFNSYSVGGGLALQWDFEIGKKRAEWKEAKAQQAKLQAQLGDAERAVRLEVEKLFREMEDAHAVLTTQEDALRAARGWVLAKTDLYENGLSELRDILDGLVQFFLSQMTHLQAIYDFNVSVAALERATGLALVPGLGDDALRPGRE